MEGADRRVDGGVDPALEGDGAGACGHVLESLDEDRLSEDGGGRGAVACLVVGLAGDLLHELCAHVLVGVLKVDLLRDAHAVFGDGGRAEGLLDDHVPAAGAEGDLHGAGELLHAVLDVLAR